MKPNLKTRFKEGRASGPVRLRVHFRVDVTNPRAWALAIAFAAAMALEWSGHVPRAW